MQVYLEEGPSAFETSRPPSSATLKPPSASLYTSTTERRRTSSQLSATLEPCQWLGEGRGMEKGQSWNREYPEEMVRPRYSANSKGLAELAEESAFIKWDGLFSPEPEDNQRQGQRARARGIKTWTSPPTETMIREEYPVGRPMSASLHTSATERSLTSSPQLLAAPEPSQLLGEGRETKKGESRNWKDEAEMARLGYSATKLRWVQCSSFSPTPVSPTKNLTDSSNGPPRHGSRATNFSGAAERTCIRNTSSLVEPRQASSPPPGQIQSRISAFKHTVPVGTADSTTWIGFAWT